MPRTLTVSLKSQSVTLTITLTLGCSRGGVVVSVHVGVNVSGVGIPFRVGTVLDRNHAAGQGAASAPVPSEEEGTTGKMVVVGVLEEETLRMGDVWVVVMFG